MNDKLGNVLKLFGSKGCMITANGKGHGLIYIQKFKDNWYHYLSTGDGCFGQPNYENYEEYDDMECW